MISDPTEMENPIEPEWPGDGAGACSFPPPFTASPGADPPATQSEQHDERCSVYLIGKQINIVLNKTAKSYAYMTLWANHLPLL
jgi:hypothetical protein